MASRAPVVDEPAFPADGTARPTAWVRSPVNLKKR
jgi:hypothetical protein